MRCQRYLTHHRLCSAQYARNTGHEFAAQILHHQRQLHTIASVQNQQETISSQDNIDRTLYTKVAESFRSHSHHHENPFFQKATEEAENDKDGTIYNTHGFPRRVRRFVARETVKVRRITSKMSLSGARIPSRHRRSASQEIRNKRAGTTFQRIGVTRGQERDMSSAPAVHQDPNNFQCEQSNDAEATIDDGDGDGDGDGEGEIEPEQEQYNVIPDKYSSMFENRDPTTELYAYTLSYSTSIHMIQTLRKLRASGLPDQITMPSSPKNHVNSVESYTTRGHATNYQSKVLRERLREREFDPEYKRLEKERKSLPIQRKDTVNKLISMITTNDVVILVSQTGSGKTTQLPQLILDWRTANGTGAACNVVCTQPRRLAAMSIARRVAKEQRTFVGGHIGYSVRFDRQLPRQPGNISYWTAAILLKALYEQPEEIIKAYSYLVIDEVHERDLTTDLVLNAIRDIMRARRQAGKRFPKVILMSATIDALDFQRYFAEPFPGAPLKVTSLEVPGRNFGVQVHGLDKSLPEFGQHAGDSRFMSLMQSSRSYLQNEDKFAEEWLSSADALQLNSSEHNSQQQKRPYPSQRPTEADAVPIELTTAIIAHALKSSDEGDVLVFLPGIVEIDRVLNCLQGHTLLGLDFNDKDRIRIYKLHASLYETNEQVFDAIPEGCRRVVLATNIAQTSITLPDVVHVVDAGQQRSVHYNPISHVREFKAYWIDKSASAQRRGRAGRTRPGHYWTLFTKERYHSLPDKPLPEIKTTDLTAACLAIKSQADSKEPLKIVLSRVMDPPDAALVSPAVEKLKRLRMLDDNEQVTPMGRFAAWLPLAPATARALLLGVLFRCFEPMLIMASHNADKPLIHNPVSLKSQIESSVSFANGIEDDRAAVISAFRSYNSAVDRRSLDDITYLEGRNIRPHAYREILSVANQLCDMLSAYQLLTIDQNADGSVFNKLPPNLSENASSAAFVRSLAMSMQHSNLGVYNAKGGSYYVETTPVFMKPFSVNARSPMRMAGNPDVRCNGQLIAYSSLMQLPGTALPLMTETSNITPLMAMLFGGSIEIINKNVVQINGWLKYRISREGSEGTKSPDDGRAVDLILEFRKTLDRVIQVTCASLRRTYQHPKLLTIKGSRSPKSPLTPGNALTEILTQGLKAVVDSDASYWDESLLRAAAEELQNRQSKQGKSQSAQ